MSEKIERVFLLDIFKMPDGLYDGEEDFSYRLVTRSSSDYNEFCLVSLGTGEITAHGTAEYIYAYLNGDNPLHQPFIFHTNLNGLIKENDLLPSYKKHSYARILIG